MYGNPLISPQKESYWKMLTQSELEVVMMKEKDAESLILNIIEDVVLILG